MLPVTVPVALAVALAVAHAITQVAIAAVPAIPLAARETTVPFVATRLAIDAIAATIVHVAVATVATVADRMVAMRAPAVLLVSQRPTRVAHESVAAPVEPPLDAVALAVEVRREVPVTARRGEEGEDVEVTVDAIPAAIEPPVDRPRVAQLGARLPDTRGAAAAVAVARARLGGERRAEEQHGGGKGPAKGTRSMISNHTHHFVLRLGAAGQRERSGCRDLRGGQAFRPGGDADDLLQGRRGVPASRRR